MSEKINVALNGNVIVEIENIKRLCELIYLFGSKNISKCIDSCIKAIKNNNKVENDLDVTYCLSELKDAFEEMTETSILVLEQD